MSFTQTVNNHVQTYRSLSDVRHKAHQPQCEYHVPTTEHISHSAAEFHPATKQTQLSYLPKTALLSTLMSCKYLSTFLPQYGYGDLILQLLES